jgi:membrane protease YdiL (CAAX protease family)
MTAGFDRRTLVPIIGSFVETPRAEQETPEQETEAWRIAAWSALVLFLILLGYGGRLIGGDPPHDALYRYDTAIGGIFIYGVLFVILLWIARGLPAREFFALRPPGSWSKALWLAFLSYIVIFAGAGLIIWALDAGKEQGLTPDRWDSSRAGAYAANFVAVAVVGPIVEELMYRGAGMTLLARYGPVVAVLATAVTFGLGHGLLLALAALVFFGVVTAVLRLKTGSIYPCILVHCAFNATGLILAVTT